MFKLAFEKGSLSGHLLEVTVPKIILGRQRDCHVRLKDDGVSRHHCALEQRDDGIYVCDLGATNGIVINGKRMREMEQRLVPGDLVRIGSAEFRAAIPAVAPAVTVALDAGKGARTEVLSPPPPVASRRTDVAQTATVSNLSPASSKPNPKSSADKKESLKRWTPLAAMLGFFRTTSGAVTLGILIAAFVAIFWLALTPSPPRQQQVAESPRATDEKRDTEWLRSILLGGAEEPKQQPPAPAPPDEPPPQVAAAPQEDAPTAPVPFRARRHSHHHGL